MTGSNKHKCYTEVLPANEEIDNGTKFWVIYHPKGSSSVSVRFPAKPKKKFIWCNGCGRKEWI